MKDNRNLIIVIGFCILLVILFSSTLIFKSKKSGEEEEIISDKILYTHQVIDIEKLDTSLYKDIMKNTSKYSIASKYNVKNDATIINANVDMYLDGKMARAIYIRENDLNLNVVQLKCDVTEDEDNPSLIKVEEMMRDFEMECKSNMGLMDLEKKPDEVSINEPYSEKIYEKKELYSARYKVEDENFTDEDYEEMGVNKEDYTKTYDINYYMDGENTLVCEFVRVL